MFLTNVYHTMPLYSDLREPHNALLRAALELASPCTVRVALDVACGNGASTAWLAAHCGSDPLVIGIDRDRAGLAQAEAGPWLVADVVHLPLRSACADLVWCVTALSLFDQPRHALAAVRRVLRPGGALVVTLAGERWVRLRTWPAQAELGQPAPADGLGDELRTTLERANFADSTLAAYLLDPPGLTPREACLPLSTCADMSPLAIGEPEPRPVLLVATAYCRS